MKTPKEMIQQSIDDVPPPASWKPGGDLAFSIEEFCRRHSLSRGTYYNLREAGKGPCEAHVLGRVLITKEAAKEWRKKITDV
ncbi:hypothetical protein UP09_14300 [Bradyrhizobium sp. LTSP885]|nr:hypothetical protein UP09_14300 [Bradyrhizobium sp. LTSP885]